MTIPKLILGRPKILMNYKCAKCHSRDVKAFPEMQITCNNCQTKFIADLEIDVYQTYAKKLNILLGEHNEVWVLAERENSKVFHADDILAPRSKKENDLYHAILEIRNNFLKFNNWDVGEIEAGSDFDYLNSCPDCGTCNNCVICSCGTQYTPKIVKTSRGRERRFKCPDCGGKNFKKSYVTNLLDHKNCPFCDSTNVVRTKFKSYLSECPKCHNKKIPKARKIPVYKLVIKREKRAMKEE